MSTETEGLEKTWPPARWRTGRRVGRTIYVQLGDGPGEHDVLVGLMDTRDLATLVVEAVNLVLGVDADGAALATRAQHTHGRVTP